MNANSTFSEVKDFPISERAKARAGASRHPTVFSAKELGAMEFQPVKWIVNDVLPEGATILAGRPKLGKSWLALDIALAVARGAYCLGNKLCTPGDALYLALEDNPRRLQSRIQKISVAGSSEPWPERLTLATEWRRSNDGGLDAIRTWARSKPSPRLVVVDVLAMFRPVRGNQDNPYESDYQAIKGLQELSAELGIGILIVHHTRKGNGEGGDAFEKISGTLGLTGAADAALILDRAGSGCTLYARGRDLQEYDAAVSFSKEDCRWTILGEAAEIHRTDERGAILAILSEATDPMTPSDIASVTGMPGNNAKQLLFKMAVSGEVAKVRKGLYVHPDRVSEFRKDYEDD
jgi:hypothetical protein